MLNTFTIKKDEIINVLTTLLFASFVVFDKSPYISSILFCISVVIFIIHASKKSYRVSIHFGPYHCFVLTFSMYALASALWATNPAWSIQKGVTIFEILVCMAIPYMHFTEGDSVAVLLKTVAIGGTLIAVYCFCFFGVGTMINWIISGTNIEDAITNQNILGMVCAFAFILSVYYMYENKWYVIGLIPCLLVVAASTSRKALILLALGTIAVLFIRSESKNPIYTLLKLVGIVIIVGILLGIIIKLNIFSGVNERMKGLIALISGVGEIDNSTNLRRMMIAKGLKQFSKTPLIGIGIGNAGTLEIKGYNYLHNNYVELLACGGIIGFLIYYSMYFYIIANLIKYRKYEGKLSKLIFCLVMLILIMDYGAVSYYDKVTYFFRMIFCLHIQNLKKETYIMNSISVES